MGGEIGAHSLFLGGAGSAAADILAFAIQDDNVPGSQFVAIVAGLWVTGSGAKIIEIRCPASGMKLVIAYCGAGARFYATPGLVVADKILFRAIGIGEVASGEDCARELDEQLRSGFGAGKVLAIGDVTSPHENGGLIVSRECACGNRGLESKTKKGSDDENRYRQCGLQVNLAVRIKFLAEIQAAEKRPLFSKGVSS